MRQKDDLIVANLLNELRLQKKKHEDMNEHQQNLLKSRNCRNDEPPDALRGFATNAECDYFNQHSLNNYSTDANSQIVVGSATDFVRKSNSDERVLKEKSVPNSESGDLSGYLRLCIGARVILIRNLDVNDGLVNGSFGKVVDVIQSQKDGPFTSVFVIFDKPSTGKKKQLPSKVFLKELLK